MRKKAFILLLVVITIFISSCQTEQPVTPPEERDANIAEYGVIAEMFYDIFEAPTDEEHVQNIMAYNGFEYKGEKYSDLALMYEYYEKKIIFDNINYTLNMEINYDGGGTEEYINYEITFIEEPFYISVNEYFYPTGFSKKISISNGINRISNYEITNEIIYDGEKSDTFYQNYLNGDYDAQIEEMLTIMDEELQPLPEDYVAPSTNK